MKLKRIFKRMSGKDEKTEVSASAGQKDEGTDVLDIREAIAVAVFPYLKKFREDAVNPPKKYSIEVWRTMLDKMMWSFNEIADGFPNDPKPTGDVEADKKARGSYNYRLGKGLLLFGRHIIYLKDDGEGKS